MDELDSDDSLLSLNGKTAKRDIVQFVEMQKFVTGGRWNKELLAREVLFEIPEQLVSYMKSKNFLPMENTPRAPKYHQGQSPPPAYSP